MNNNQNLEVDNLISQLKSYTNQIEDILSSLKDQDYIRIGESGDVWTGDVAESAHQTFDSLVVKFPEFSSLINEYSDNVLNK